MNAKEIERAAYMAARILTANTSAQERVVDTIAGIIRDVLELYNPECPYCWEGTHNSTLDTPQRRRTAAVLEFPRRASS